MCWFCLSYKRIDDEYVCEMKRQIIKDPEKISEWCPLDDAEEKPAKIEKCSWCGYPEGYWAEKRTVHCKHK